MLSDTKDLGDETADPLVTARKRLTQFTTAPVSPSPQPATINPNEGLMDGSPDFPATLSATDLPTPGNDAPRAPSAVPAPPPPAAAPPIPPPPPPPGGDGSAPQAPLVNPIPNNLPQVQAAQAPVGSADRVQQIYQQQQHPTAQPDGGGILTWTGADTAELNPNNTPEQNLAARLLLDQHDAEKNGGTFDPSQSAWNDVNPHAFDPATGGTKDTGAGPTSLGQSALDLMKKAGPVNNPIQAPQDAAQLALQEQANDPAFKAEQQARIQQILNDPTTSPEIRKLVQNPDYATPGDKSGNAGIVGQIQDAQAASAQRAAPTAPASDAGGGMVASPGGMVTEGAGLAGMPAGSTPTASDATPQAPQSPTQLGATRLQDYLKSAGGIDNTQAITPGSDLIDQAVLPGSDVDRFALAQKRLADFRAARQPQHDSNVRKILDTNAGLGRLGSGMLNTDVGNEANAFEQQQTDMENNLLSNAIEGTIGDARSNRAELRGERGYQGGLENQAYGRGVDQYKMEQDAQGTAFDQAMRRAQFGEQGNPSGVDILAGQGKRQSADSDMTALSNVMAAYAGSKSGSGTAPTSAGFMDYLKGLIKSGSIDSSTYEQIMNALPAMSGGPDAGAVNA